MAIRRCPYCKAIIDEGLEYCSNCGTQLIFPEDEFIDEEIPGEKIVDVTDEEEEPEEEDLSEEPEDLSPLTEDTEKEGMTEIEEKENMDVGTSVIEEEDEAAIKESGLIEDEEPVQDDEDELIPEKDETLSEADEITHEPEPEVKIKSEIIEEIEEPSTEEVPETVSIGQVEEVYAGVEEETGEVIPQGDSVTFETEDLEKIVDPAEKEKEEIEQFLSSLKEEREKTKKYYEETGELPPWAQSMREGSISSLASEEDIQKEGEPMAEEVSGSPFTSISAEEKVPPEEETRIEEESSHVREDSFPSDTGMGLPEGIDQKGLPFSRDFQEEETIEESRPHFRYRDMNFPSWIKSRVFDVLMIAVLWLITVWLASAVVKVSFFQLMTASTIPILIFLAILLIVYFFLFFFFLGETLGDQLFSQEE